MVAIGSVKAEPLLVQKDDSRPLCRRPSTTFSHTQKTGIFVGCRERRVFLEGFKRHSSFCVKKLLDAANQDRDVQLFLICDTEKNVPCLPLCWEPDSPPDSFSCSWHLYHFPIVDGRWYVSVEGLSRPFEDFADLWYLSVDRREGLSFGTLLYGQHGTSMHGFEARGESWSVFESAELFRMATKSMFIKYYLSIRRRLYDSRSLW